jgi:Leucyl/phenylalanyl-tRNA protein transferase
MRAYAELFDAGHVHTFEVWNEKGELAGGGYGVSVGGAFSTESQFSHEPNTSKIGFTVLNWHLQRWGYGFNDGRLMTPTCHDMGFRGIPRAEYLVRLAEAGRHPSKVGRWQTEVDVATLANSLRLDHLPDKWDLSDPAPVRPIAWLRLSNDWHGCRRHRMIGVRRRRRHGGNRCRWRQSRDNFHGG